MYDRLLRVTLLPQKFTIVEPHRKRVRRHPQILLMIHTYGTGWSPLIPSITFGLGVGEDARTTYYFGPFWRLAAPGWGNTVASAKIMNILLIQAKL